MLRKSLPLAFTLSLLAPTLSLASEEKLDQILAELQSLKEQVASLEERLAAVESVPAPTPAASGQANEQSGWFDKMRVELKKADVRATGAWSDPETWNRIELGMSEEAAIDLLGEPSRRKFSVRKDTDEILIYEGDLEGSGELVEGEVRLYKGKVRRFVAPDFPSQ